MNQEMIFSPLDRHNLRWQKVSETFWIQLKATFADYKADAHLDIDLMAAYVLEENVFYEGVEYTPIWYLNPISAMAMRRLYCYYRLKAITYDAFLYQFDEMNRHIEAFFQINLKGEQDLTPLVPPRP